jgi:hypothetical protein
VPRSTTYREEGDKEFDDIIEQLEFINTNLERLVVLKEYELGVHLEMSRDGNGPYVPIEVEE